MVKKANTYILKKKKKINHCSVAVLFWEAMAAIPSDAWVNPPRVMPAFVSKLKGVFLFWQANWGHSEINKRLQSYFAANPQHLQFSPNGVTPVQSSADGDENDSLRTYPPRFATPHNAMCPTPTLKLIRFIKYKLLQRDEELYASKYIHFSTSPVHVAFSFKGILLPFSSGGFGTN